MQQMSDYEKLKDVLEGFGINFTESKEEDGNYKITIDKGIGYYGFVAEFTFDEKYKFLNHGVWE